MTEFIKTKNLPNDIKKNIFHDHFEYILKYEELKQILNSNVSQKLNISLLLPYVNKFILNDQKYISFLLKNNKIFKNIYTNHYIDHNKNFIHMNVNESFALSWLMYLYH